MSTKLVTYIATNCLPCGCQGTANVAMCTIYNQTVPGQILESDGSSGSWIYTIQYDSADLPVGVSGLATSDITGVLCKGCLTTWIEELFTPQVVTYSSDYLIWDFKASAPGDTHDLVQFTITNPSKRRKLKGLVGYNADLHLVNLTDFQVTFDAVLLQDGSGLTDTARGIGQYLTGSGGTFLAQFGSSAAHAVEIAPGASSTFVLRFTSGNTVPVTDTSVALGQAWFNGALSA